jgi:hypothetical protein
MIGARRFPPEFAAPRGRPRTAGWVEAAGRGRNGGFYQTLGNDRLQVLKDVGIPDPDGNAVVPSGHAYPEMVERPGESSLEDPDRPSQLPRHLLNGPSLETTEDDHRAINPRQSIDLFVNDGLTLASAGIDPRPHNHPHDCPGSSRSRLGFSADPRWDISSIRGNRRDLTSPTVPVTGGGLRFSPRSMRWAALPQCMWLPAEPRLQESCPLGEKAADFPGTRPGQTGIICTSRTC